MLSAPGTPCRGEQLTVTFLGTSSGQPTLARGLSCVALQHDGDLYLFDCGEGAQMQLRRAGLRFGRLAAIFITHMHGDHVTGLPGMLMSLQMTGRTAPLPLIGPPELEAYVRGTAAWVCTGFGFELQFTQALDEGVVYRAAQCTVSSARLEHRIPAHGYRFEEHDAPGVFDVAAAKARGLVPGPAYRRLQLGESVLAPDGSLVEPSTVVGPPRRGRVIAYCTDTRPCAGSVHLAQSADLLIHESTFAQERLQDALDTGHSTAAEAAGVAREARARALMLTHFSPRYSEVGLLLDEARAVFEPVQAAEELCPYELG